MRVKESQNERADKEIVNFLHIDTSKITFSKPKPNKHNGTQIGILYNGSTLFVKYKGYTPFGLNENYDKDGNYQGTSMQINCDGEYLEKAKELDEFFIDYLYSLKNNKKIHREAVAGYDEHGQGGKESVKNRIKLLMKKEYIKITHQRWSFHYFLEMIE